MTTLVKETITVYEKDGTKRETIIKQGDAAVRDLAKILYCKLRKFKYTVKDNGYGRITSIIRDEFGKVVCEFENCEYI